MQEISINQQSVTIPHLAIETAESAIASVNRWLHREVGMALNVLSAVFSPETFCWHLPVHLAYAETGSLGIIGDVYIHAATGEFVGAPTAEELQQRADALAAAHGVTE